MNADDATLARLATQVGSLLQSQGHRLATAESCTGGWVAKCITDVAGSSNWFDCGFITYSNEAKHEQLDVSADTLARCGAVSSATVRQMTAGALRHSHAQVALAVSGIAGPGGGSAEKPVGLVWLAWQRRDGEAVTRCARFDGDRDAVRRQAVAAALAGLLELYGPADND